MRRLLLVAILAALAVPGVAAARPAPVTWCGTDEVSANRVPDLELTSTAQVRFVYVVPSDAPDHFLADAPGIATDAAWIDQWWQGQDASRTPRFDRYPFPGCTSTFGGLDIGFIRLAGTSASYMTGQTPAFALLDELRGKLGADQKTIMYFDGPIHSPDICGETDYQSQSSGGDVGIAFVYIQSACSLMAPGQGGAAAVAAHELTHNMDAVDDQAPHVCPSNPSHVCDSRIDLMYPYLADGVTLDNLLLDVGRDDYYGHSGSWFDVQDSPWLEHLPQFTLTVAAPNHGTVSASTDSTDLGCNTGCASVPLDNGTAVKLEAVPAAGFVFGRWSGSCTGAAPTCTVQMTQAQSVAATFAAAPLRLSVSIGGKGKVSSSPRGVACPGACAHDFAAGSTVRLSATPAKGWKLARWSGGCTGRGLCRVSLAQARSVRAVFVRK